MDKTRILIVEDDLDLSDMLTDYFSVQNYEVLTAAWGEEALQISRATRLDLIMLDINLPDITGFDICRQLRLQESTREVPIIFLTEKRNRVEKLQGLELGVLDYITKPFDIQELRLRVRNAISQANHQSLINPRTGLPEGRVVDDKLAGLFYSGDQWAVLQVSLCGVDSFRDACGVVAADDVLRALALIVQNASRNQGHPGDFVGHLAPETFVIISRVDRVDAVHEQIVRRMQQSQEYFNPLPDPGTSGENPASTALELQSATLLHTADHFADVATLRKTLAESLTPARVESRSD